MSRLLVFCIVLACGVVALADASDGIALSETSGAVAPNEASSAFAPSDASSAVPPTDAPSDVKPTDASSAVVPSDAPSAVVPTDMSSDGKPTDASSAVAPTDVPSDVKPTDAPSDVAPSNAPSAVAPIDAPRKPIYVEAFVQRERGTEKVAGDLVRWDERAIVLATLRGERVLSWTELTPSSAFVIRSRLIDRSVASDWLVLARFGFAVGATDQAHVALSTATRMDPSLSELAENIRVEARRKPGLAATQPGDDEWSAVEPAFPRNVPRAQPGRQRGKKQDDVRKYIPATAREHEQAIELARRRAEEVQKQLGIGLVELQTDHFILFTDWDRREYRFLRENLEAAYTLVSAQFDLSPKDNLFVGKLPVFMFARHDDFLRFAREVDRFEATEQVQGYYRSTSRGFGHLAMTKPDGKLSGNDLRLAEQQWAYVLTHEFVHAFVARYRTNATVPRWLNEGIAELIAQARFKRPGVRTWARRMASSDADLMRLFDDEFMPGGEFYPVMMTLVEMLVQEDRQKFIAFFNACKDDEDPEEALRRLFGVDYAGLLRTWRRYASRLGG